LALAFDRKKKKNPIPGVWEEEEKEEEASW